ncbi:EAL domain-containing protein [Pseudomonas chlororaphis]|uniref:EAL domain-containing protein n=1 Tax=Pseudomonas chlororaphis TaxID=587753 RepID=A0A1Q8EM93_9PSED|nr:EAL domain-containing protein [Pseudomonas chlororaphis]OLF52899.1 hypothetical protein BTN82_19175 [Pseudomonas chlororaphis]
MFSERDIYLGLQRKEFLPYLQPIFDLIDGSFIGAEVLARWIHPERGMLMPSAFLDTVIEKGMMDEVFFELLEQGLDVHRYSTYGALPMKLAFNVHPVQLANKGFAIRVNSVLRSHAVSASNVSFELTESGSLDDDSSTFENLYNLRVMGCGLVIDDFGVGYSSLQRLFELPFTELKIDASFVASILTSPRCSDIVESILALANTLEMTVIAEGIETECQLSKLRELGCAFGQGYLYSKPLSPDEMLCWLEEGEGRAWLPL